MIEVEIRAKVDEFDEIKNKLNEIGAKFKKTIKQDDRVYGAARFLDDEHKIIEGGVSSRLRTVNGKTTLDFKEILREKSGFEINFEVSDINIAERFLKKLEYKEGFALKKTRSEYNHNDFTICLDDVEKLGLFIEIEKELPSEDGAEETRNECIKLLKILAPNAQIENRKYGDLLQDLKNKEIK